MTIPRRRQRPRALSSPEDAGHRRPTAAAGPSHSRGGSATLSVLPYIRSAAASFPGASCSMGHGCLRASGRLCSAAWRAPCRGSTGEQRGAERVAKTPYDGTGTMRDGCASADDASEGIPLLAMSGGLHAIATWYALQLFGLERL